MVIMKRYLSLVLLFVATCLNAQSLKIEAPNVVAVGEPFRVVFTADGKISDFEWSEPDGWTLMWGPQKGSSSSITIINGKRESSKTESYTYLFSAEKKGTYTIPVAVCKVDGSECSTAPVRVEVVEDDSYSSSQGGGSQSSQGGNQSSGSASQGSSQKSSDPAITGTVSNEDIFMRLNLSKTSAVKGEPVTAVLKLYTRQDIAGFEDFKLPTFNGFWSKETYAPTNLELKREEVGGKIYNTTVIRRYVLIPQQEGNITIEPAEAVCQLRVRAQGRGRSIFDDFFDNYQTVRKRVVTPTITFHVTPLPAGAPSSFAGGVGQFNISARFSTDSIAANEAASLIVTVSGKGNVTMLSAPRIQFPNDFDMYDVKTTDRSESNGTMGSKVFEYPFIARSYGDFTVGPIKYSYYDNSKGQYVTTEAPAVTIRVSSDGMEQEGAASGPAGGVRQSVRNIGSDIRYIAAGNPGLKPKGEFFVTSWPFYAILAAIIALFFIICAVLGKMQAMRADVAGTRNRKANKVAVERLRRSKSYLQQGLVGAYYEELHKAVMGYISDKLTMPQSDLSKENISEALAGRGVAQETIDSLMNIIATCEAARYAPDYTPEQMETQYRDALQTITAIESGVRKGVKAGKKAAVATVAALLLAFSFDAVAADEPLWTGAAEAYAGGNWQEALDMYKQIEAQGRVSDRLYYNIANAYYKNGNLGECILYYEKALKLNPSNADARFNLDIARESVLDRIEVVPEFILVKWVRDVKYLLSSNAWAWIALAAVFLVAVLLLAFRFGRSRGGRTTAFVFACLALLAGIVAYLFSLSERGDVMRESEAVIMQPVTSVKSSPGEEGKSLFILHEGTKVQILDKLGSWDKVEISDGRQGWLPAADVEVI